MFELKKNLSAKFYRHIEISTTQKWLEKCDQYRKSMKTFNTFPNEVCIDEKPIPQTRIQVVDSILMGMVKSMAS